MKVNVTPKEISDGGWFATLNKVPEPRVLNTDIETEWLVIGGGWVGISAARRLAELNHEDRVVLVDAGRIGNNAAGRCAGFAIDLAHNPRAKNFADNEKGNIEESLVNREGIRYLTDAVEEYNIECDWSPEGKIHSAATSHGEACLKSFANALDRIGESYEWYNAAKMQEITGSHHYHLGLFAPGTILMQPAALLRGLQDNLPENVTVYENTPIIEVNYGKDSHVCLTKSGKIKTKKVILANNGWLSYFGFFTGRAIPIYTYASMTRQLTAEELSRLGGRKTFGLIPADPFGTTVRKTADNRLFIRNVYRYVRDFITTESDVAGAKERHQISFDARFPAISNIGFQYTWGGALCLSQNSGGTVFGELASGVFGAGFCNGTGLAKGAIYGKAIAELASGKSSRTIDILNSRVKPGPTLPRFILEAGVRINTAYRFHKAGPEA
ncbi:NAD(P)/FAD-dependent oxidoreductase [Oceanimonas doudoroffii]|uniref:FAD-dependent oxidoreductase n=1 Tax=Oceanimonas doudoroffii TaxID=84158 RepID=A0A233RIH5_9GAMM|nr:FAD-binding oxidoreductase [Oceanimonas doudoroffii]OXY83197.1 FAD-dependent oxidoreductase [Oceanimonas doudoroffii]